MNNTYFKRHVYSMQADSSNASKIKKNSEWPQRCGSGRLSTLKTTLISVEQESAHWNNLQVTMFTVCASRSITAQLNPLSSPLMRRYGKLPSQNHQKPVQMHCIRRLTASTAFHMVQAASANRSTGLFDNLIFLQALYKVAIQRNFFKMSYVKGAIEGVGGDTKRVVAQVVGSCDDALEISFL